MSTWLVILLIVLAVAWSFYAGTQYAYWRICQVIASLPKIGGK